MIEKCVSQIILVLQLSPTTNYQVSIQRIISMTILLLQSDFLFSFVLSYYFRV
jgi:hypothetical protein